MYKSHRRFSITLLENFFGDSTEAENYYNSNRTKSKNLAKSLSVSRSACKLKYLVGCAPVCYGVPVHLLITT